MLGLEVTPDLEAKLKAALFRLLDEPKSPILNEGCRNELSVP
jgi:hypothetical protein